MLSPKNHLTLGKIAEEWAAENVGKPFSLDREQILDVFEAGLKKHEFDHVELTIEQAPKDVLIGAAPISNQSYVRQGKSWRPVTYGDLDKMLFRCRDEITRQLWLEGLRISKDDFRQWCDRHQDRCPKFWFGEAIETPDPTRSGMAGRPTAKHIYKAELKRRAGANLMRDKVSQEAKELHNWLKSQYPKINPGTPKAIENNIRNLYHDLKAANPPK